MRHVNSTTKMSLAFLSLCIAAVLSNADETHLVGKFGHAYTNNRSEPVWSITKNQKQFTIFQYGDKSKFSAQLASSKQKQEFWSKMFWDSNLSAQATCLISQETMICHIDSATRKNIPDLQSNQTDFFYYDPMVGLMEIKKKIEHEQ